jgi:cell division septation protein DedD
MNEIGPLRPPLSRAVPVLAIGVALVLAGGFAVGIFVGRKPVPVVPPTAEILPPRPVPAVLPDLVPSLHESPPIPVVLPPSPPPVAPPIAHEPVVVPKPPAAVLARPEPVVAAVPVPERKPAPHPAAAPKRAIEARPPARPKPVARHETTAKPHPPASPPLPQPANGGRWVVQVGAFQSDDHAKLLVDTLAFHGHPARIAGGHDRTGHDWFFVQTPGYATRAEAEQVAGRLAAREHVPTFVFETRTPPGN